MFGFGAQPELRHLSFGIPTYIDGVHGIATPQLPAHHHGLPGAPACAAHRAPPGAHMNLQTALVGAAAAR